jgi:hypothetical protein
MRGLPRLGALGVAIALAGCGGGGSRPTGAGSSPAAQIRAYLAAVARGDGKTACALLTPEARSGLPSLSEKLHSPDCAGEVAELSRLSEPLHAPRVEVDAGDDRATGTITSRRPPYRTQVLLRREGGVWLIAFPPALVERYKARPGIPNG